VPENEDYKTSLHHDDDVLEQLFNELFREYEHRLYAFIIKVVKSDAQTKDILQDVFLKLWQVREQLPEIQNINAFLYKLAENKVYDFLRRAARYENVRNEFWQSYQQYHSPDGGDLEAKEFNGIIQKAIEQLPPQRKAIYLLTTREGMKRHEVAAELNLSPNTVRNQLSEAIHYIRQYVNKHLSGFFSFLF
jgi:RNA polymerase sigma-70 factor (ECF subfamily)